ncbi:hypothetical protein JS531_02060 [Bifidobacterium sp. CP2]|uniref:hypothetical protein n=1 Tax=Bifidobacterium sp. CP2 TaxID=2809025 RepID=UPI001BDC3F49|nr:hypothetical protein [Bifidobacterium sp. CP2]MBT1180775.1 hypothetical protein [Bifidobacterium sp. CP2]
MTDIEHDERIDRTATEYAATEHDIRRDLCAKRMSLKLARMAGLFADLFEDAASPLPTNRAEAEALASSAHAADYVWYGDVTAAPDDQEAIDTLGERALTDAVAGELPSTACEAYFRVDMPLSMDFRQVGALSAGPKLPAEPHVAVTWSMVSRDDLDRVRVRVLLFGRENH